jgi:glycosyltransferase involved in cell wall biosynthesis
MRRLLAIAPYPFCSADTRYRIYQFKKYLEAAGWNVTVHSFMDDALFQMYYVPGKVVEKLARTLRSTLLRLSDLVAASQYDVVLLHKEAFPFGPPLMEAILRRRAPHVIYDMDDAYWTHPPQLSQIGCRLRDPERISRMLRVVDHVLAGNEFLASYARQYNCCVTVFPTVLDTERYYLRKEYQDDMVTIGWVGRWSSSPYLNRLNGVLARLGKIHADFGLRLVGAEKTDLTGIPITAVPWRLDKEIEDIAGFDIGIMPIPDDVYGQGKCGLKLLQYMALGIPAVASAVGANNSIIQDGINGFLANSDEEWFDKLNRLIIDPELRRTLGEAGRRTVEERFSVRRAAPVLLEIMNSL